MRRFRQRGWRGLAVLALALAAACTSPEERFADHVARGREYESEGKPEEALLEYQSALKIDSDNAELNERIGGLLKQEGRLAEAALYYREAHRLDPSRIEAAMQEARLVLRNDPARARQLVEDGLARAPESAAVHRARSALALAGGDTATAVEAARRAVALEDGEPANWNQLGLALQGRIATARRRGGEIDEAAYEEALGAFEQADRVEGGHVGARLERAHLFAAVGRREQAEEAFREAAHLAREQGNAAAHVLVAEAAERYAVKAGNVAFRRWAMRQLVSADPSRLDAWETLSRLLGGRAGRSEEVLLELLSLRGDDPRAHALYAGFLAREGRGSEAIAHLERTLAGGIESPPLSDMLVQLQLAWRGLADARATYVRLADDAPDHPVTRRAEARIALAEGRAADAAEILRPLAQQAESPETLRLLALAELELGGLEAANTAIDRAQSLADEFPVDILRLKARIRHRSGRWSDALRVLTLLAGRGEKLSPSEKLIGARSLYELGDAAEGRRVLEEILSGPEPLPDAAVEFSRREARRAPGEALAHLRKAFDLEPSNVEVVQALTDLELRRGRVEPALARLDQLVEARLAGPEVLLLRAGILTKTGELERAEADALRAFESSPALPGAIELLFAIYRAQGRLDEARRSFEEAEAAGVLHSGARLLLARLYLHAQQYAEARTTLEKVVAEHPDMLGARNDLAFLLAKEGRDLERALELAREAQRANATDPRIADTLGYVYYRMGRHEAALQTLRGAIELAEAGSGAVSPVIPYHLGLTLQALGRSEPAARAFARALEIDPAFSESEDARTRLEAARRAPPEAPNPS